jgi:FixJ family two-component response regulator
MRGNVFIVHRSDALLRAIDAMLAQEGYRVRSAGCIEALLGELAAALRPAVLLVDEDAAGPQWRTVLERIPADIPRVVLTWRPGLAFPAEVAALGKPYRARDLLETVARQLDASRAREPAR